MRCRVWLLACVLPLLTGAGAAAADPDQAATLEDRARTFWQARVQEDWDTVYSLLPDDEREKVTREAFIATSAKGPFKYLTAEVTEAETMEEVGWVKVTYTAKARDFEGLRPRQVTLWQLWQRVEDHWRLMPADYISLVPSRPPSARPANEEAALTRRAVAYWKAMEAQDLSTLYDFADPQFRAAVTREEFLKRKSGFVYSSVHIDWAEVTDASGRVRASYLRALDDPTLRKQQPEPIAAVDLWTRLDGQWYRDITNEQLKKDQRKGSQ